jgi:protein TonB
VLPREPTPEPKRKSLASGLPEAVFGGPPALVYHPAAELHERPLIRTHVEPQFPAGATVPEGRVRLRLFIGADGNVDEVRIDSVEPQGAFGAAAAQAFAGATFTPGKIGGKPVKSLMTIEVLFGAPVPLDPRRAASFAMPR